MSRAISYTLMIRQKLRLREYLNKQFLNLQIL